MQVRPKSFEERQREQDTAQVALNGGAATLGTILGFAARQMARYPQYDGEFEESKWERGVMTRQVETKGGVRFEAGDVVAVERERAVWPEGWATPLWGPAAAMLAAAREYRMVWSVRGAGKCPVARSDVKIDEEA